METNRRLLREQFADRVLALAPGSVLDVGTGSGELVVALRAAGRASWGVELDRARLAEAENRAALLQADALRLPFADASADWVCLRHVAHHLPEPRPAFEELWRVARRGLLLAEPWYDGSLPDQRFGARIDAWLDRQLRRRDHFHADPLDANALRALLPGTPAEVSLHTWTGTRPWTMEDFESECERACGGLPPDPNDARELDLLRQIVERGAATLNGSSLVVARKPT